MLLKNVSRFLASASLVLCSVMASLPPAYAQDAEPASKKPYPVLNTPVRSLPVLDGVNVEGDVVHLGRRGDLPLYYQLELKDQAGGGAIRIMTTEGVVCAVSTEQYEDAEGVPGKVYYRISKTAGENTFLERNVYDFYMAAHELSHCFNHVSGKANAQIAALAANPSFTGYGSTISLIDSSIKETYADFSAVLLGASKTGDWAIFNKGVLPFRASLIDLQHLTLNATTNLIKGINPKTLKGMTFAEVNALTNKIFKDRFMNAAGEIDLKSSGVRDIVQEFTFHGERLRVLAGVPAYQQNAVSFIDTANSIRGFGTALYKEPVANADAFAFISALHVVDARGMKALALDSSTSSEAGMMLLAEVVLGMTQKEKMTWAIDQYMSEHLFGQKSKIAQYGVALEKWQRHGENPDAVAALGAKLANFIADNVRHAADPALQSAKAGLEQRIQDRLSAARSGQPLMTRNDLNSDAGQKQALTPQYAEREADFSR
jgi:hypothetical protein